MQIVKIGIVLAGAVTMLALADTPGRHPRYLHARTDLRTAQFLMRVHDEPNVMRHAHDVDAEIDLAIREIDRAAVIDRKDMEEHPRIDTSLDRPGRFRKVMALLTSSRRDIAEEEDNPRAIGWRDAAFHHIDVAIEQLRRAARELRIDRLEGF
jgi:hypothetical protein